MRYIINILIFSIFVPAAAYAELRECPHSGQVEKIVTKEIRAFRKSGKRFPRALMWRDPRILEGSFGTNSDGSLDYFKIDAYFQAAFRMKKSDIKLPFLPGLSLRLKKNNLVHLCWSMESLENYQLKIYMMRGYRMDDPTHTSWSENLGAIIGFIPRRIFGNHHPNARVTSANLKVDPFYGSISFLEKILLKLPIPDFIREKILEIPFLITHDVLSIFVGTGIERFIITQEGIELAYGFDALGDSHKINKKFLSWDEINNPNKDEEDQEDEEESDKEEENNSDDLEEESEEEDEPFN